MNSLNTRYYLIVKNSNAVLLNEANKIARFTNQLQVLTDINANLRGITSSINTNIKATNASVYLELSEQYGLSLIPTDTTLNPLHIKDIYTKINQRTQTTNELLIQAIKEPKGAAIFDLTAGLGKDAIIMAKHGYKVTMVEQNPLLATIVYYALQYHYISSNNLTLIFADSLNLFKSIPPFFKNTTQYPDVIYLDPMFNHKKAAKPKKDMQIIQQIITMQQSLTKPLQNEMQQKDLVTTDHKLFMQAMQYATKKIVVKRDNNQKCIIDAPKPSYTKLGKTIRYDVYLITH